MSTARRCAGDDGKGDANCEGPANLEDTAKGCHPDGVLEVQCERCDRGYAGEDVEECACGFRHALPKPAWSCMFQVEGALRNGLSLDYLATDMADDSICDTDLEVIGLEAVYL